jgi:hypothetical protein
MANYVKIWKTSFVNIHGCIKVVAKTKGVVEIKFILEILANLWDNFVSRSCYALCPTWELLVITKPYSIWEKVVSYICI